MTWAYGVVGMVQLAAHWWAATRHGQPGRARRPALRPGLRRLGLLPSPARQPARARLGARASSAAPRTPAVNRQRRGRRPPRAGGLAGVHVQVGAVQERRELLAVRGVDADPRRSPRPRPPGRAATMGAGRRRPARRRPAGPRRRRSPGPAPAARRGTRPRRAGPAGHRAGAGRAASGPPSAAARRPPRDRSRSLTVLKPLRSTNSRARVSVRCARPRSPSPPAPRAAGGWAARSAGRCRPAPRCGPGRRRCGRAPAAARARPRPGP